MWATGLWFSCFLRMSLCVVSVGGCSKTLHLNTGFLFLPFPPQNLTSRYYAIKNRLQLFFKDFYPATCFSREDLSLIALLYHSSLVSSALRWIKITGLNQGSSSHLISSGGVGASHDRHNKAKQIQTEIFFFLLNLDMCHWNAWALISLFKNGNNFITWGCKIK